MVTEYGCCSWYLDNALIPPGDRNPSSSNSFSSNAFSRSGCTKENNNSSRSPNSSLGQKRLFFKRYFLYHANRLAKSGSFSNTSFLMVDTAYKDVSPTID